VNPIIQSTSRLMVVGVDSADWWQHALLSAHRPKRRNIFNDHAHVVVDHLLQHESQLCHLAFTIKADARQWPLAGAIS
jgi:hypothetical protein